MPSLVSQRMPEKMSTERAALDDLLGSTVLAHVGLVVDGSAVVFPTGFAVIDDRLVIHGSTGSRWMRAIAAQEVSVTVTKVDGVVVARSTFESSMLYRSAMFFGRFETIDPADKPAVLDALSDRFIPNRSAEVRPSSKKELAATVALALPIDRWSLRVSADWPEDEESDIAGDAWAGFVRFGAPSATAEAAPDLRDGIEPPASVHELLAHPERIV
ncbi:pyridoxamine 5'-phosphate oxidase family protein [Leucobacter iarius]|uniref:Pyridoxamine 5'-phosphate oxidase family protein n=1 Tax=Leucobacter iarius TaxID=333963 RepID=A0ABP4XXC4_9MICO